MELTPLANGVALPEDSEVSDVNSPVPTPQIHNAPSTPAGSAAHIKVSPALLPKVEADDSSMPKPVANALKPKNELQSSVTSGAEKGGEGGKGAGTAPDTPLAALTPSNAAFLGVIFEDVSEGATAIVAAKSGDPQTGGWFPVEAKRVGEVCKGDRNTYFNCSSTNPEGDSSVTAKKERAAAFHALVLDDVGTKVDRSLIGAAIPTWSLETSPGNFQVGFKLSPPLTSPDEVAKLQERIASAGLTDKGALGMVRWARLPNGINGKPKYESEGNPFVCRLEAWNPTKCYSASALLAALNVAEKQGATPPSRSEPASRRRSPAANPGQVYVPRPAENAVIAAFKERGLYKKVTAPGRHEVSCPWRDEHTDQLDTGAAYFEPDEAYPMGGYCCQHSHKDKYHIGQVLEFFGLTELEGRHKPLIRLEPGEMNAILSAAEEVLADRGDIYQSGGILVTVQTDPISGDSNMVPISDSALTLALSAASEWERYNAKSREWKRADPHPRHVGMLYKAQSYDSIPLLRGLARQPYYDEVTGELIVSAGYHPASKRLGMFDAAKFPAPVATEAAAREALKLLQDDLLGEFHFASEVDRSAALAAIFTATTRPTLGLAPAFHITAPSSGSGKSYLCETIALFAGPGGSSRVSYPKSSEEATKSVLSLLLAAPAVIEFDDMDSDWIPYGSINRMLTSKSVTDRILGVSKVATVSTSVLVLGSGNNVGPIRDLARRVLTINLNAKSETPGTLSYKGNPVAALKADRERHVMAVLTIIEAWKAAGRPKTTVPSIASYGGTWADHCRHPLIWLGLPDPATVLLEQMKTDPDSDTLLRLLTEWHRMHGEKVLTLRRFLDETGEYSELHDALLDLPVLDRGQIHRSRLGQYLRRNREKIVGGFMLQKAENSERAAWKVVKVGKGEEPAIPPSPPLPVPEEPVVADNRAPEDEF